MYCVYSKHTTPACTCKLETLVMLLDVLFNAEHANTFLITFIACSNTAVAIHHESNVHCCNSPFSRVHYSVSSQ